MHSPRSRCAMKKKFLAVKKPEGDPKSWRSLQRQFEKKCRDIPHFTDAQMDTFWAVFAKLEPAGRLDGPLADVGFVRSSGSRSSVIFASQPSSSVTDLLGSGVRCGDSAAEQSSSLSAENEHTPSSGGAWTLTGKKQKKLKEKTTLLDDILVPEGWNVPTVKTAQDVKMATGGVFLASPAATRKELHNFHGADMPVAALCSVDLKLEDVSGTRVAVFVKDKDGRRQTRDRVLYQLGQGKVQFDCTAPRRQFAVDSVQVVVQVRQQHAPKDVWETVQRAPNSSAKKWLESKASATVLDTKPATTSETGGNSIQVISFVSSICMPAVLKMSGTDGVFVRPFVDKDSGNDAFRVVPLPSGISLEDALAKAKFLGDMAFGVVSMKNGFGIRVPVADFDKAARALRPDDATSLIGKMYHVSGLPLACGKEALAAFMYDWNFTPVYTFVQGRTRTWAVRAEVAPFEEMLQHDDGLVLIKEAPPRPPQPRTSTKWTPIDGKRPPAKFPPTWADVAQDAKKKQNSGDAKKPGQAPLFTKGKDLSVREVNSPVQERNATAAGSQASSLSAEPSIMAAVGKIDELLAAFRRLEARVDGITQDMVELRGDGVGRDAMLTDEEGGRDPEHPQRKTLRIR